MPAYLKIADKFPADYTFVELRAYPIDSPDLHQAPNSHLPKTSVSLESFNARLQVKIGQQDLICA